MKVLKDLIVAKFLSNLNDSGVFDCLYLLACSIDFIR